MIKKKKSLGQHFLNSAHYLSMVADAARIKKGDHILEVGPGEGALTAELLARGALVTAVEKDARLISFLREKFAKEIADKRLVLHEADVLEFELEQIKGGYKAVGNIPYYITGALFKKFLSAKHQPGALVFLVQKEVAQRIAREKKESILSLSVKAYGAPRYVKTVPAGAFNPPPKVDSAVVAIDEVSRNNFADAKHEKKFFELVRAGFAQKRKLLKRNLEPLLGKKAPELLQTAGILENARAEDVALAQWLTLAKEAA
jgi:16S rRNA (adenine1518-N6/adenine1519-N6)-dimethyltransferase